MKSTRFFVFLFFSFHFHTGNVIRWGSKETIQNLQVIEPCRSALYRVRNYHEVDIGIICRTIIFQRYTLSYYMCIRYTYRNMCKRSLDVIIKDIVHWTCIERAINRVVFHKIWKVYKCVDRTNSGRFLVLIKMYVFVISGLPIFVFRSSYLCNNCGKTYKWKESLNLHKRMECGIEPRFSCKVCGRKFKHKHHLAKHHKSIHNYVDLPVLRAAF